MRPLAGFRLHFVGRMDYCADCEGWSVPIPTRFRMQRGGAEGKTLRLFVKEIVVMSRRMLKMRLLSMEGRIPVSVWMICASIGMFLGAPAVQAATQEEPDSGCGLDIAAIEQLRRAFNEAYDASDAAGIAAVLDTDAVFLPPGRTPLVGRDSIVAHYTQRFEDVRRFHFELHPGAILVLGDAALLHSSFSRVEIAAPGVSARHFTGYYLWVLKRQPAGDWKVLRDIWNEIELAGE